MQMTRCTKCMEELEEGVSICPYCGYEQDSTVQPPNALKRNIILHGRYYIGNVIGQGGFGITYVGWDLVLETKVAVKEYFPSGIASRTNSYSNEIRWDFTGGGTENWSEGMDRFLKEARKMARLDSVPAIVRVRDAFSENQTAYIVMDFVEGDTLKKYLLSHGVLRYEECMTLLAPILDSLAVIHDQGFIHRDISPDNIMLQPDGTARLLDLGAAVDLEAGGGRASMAVVKRNFSAPEQYMESEQLGSWTDVYAMGATIYYCMTGKLVPEALERGVKKVPLFFNPELSIPAHVIDALNSALELNAGNRIRDMRELKQRLVEGKRTAEAADRPSDLKASPVQDLNEAEFAARKGTKKRIKCGLIALGALFALIILTIAGGSVSGTEPEKLAAAGTKEPAAVEETAAGLAVQETTSAQEVIDYARYVEVEPADLTYYAAGDGSGLTLSAFTGEGESYIKLPDEIDGVPVIRLGTFLFSDNKALEGVVLPEGLQEIESGAFKGCYYLKQIELPGGLKTIGESAFYDCYNLHQIGLSEGLETIGEFAFANCTGLERMELPEGLKSIEYRAFYGAGIQEITIPSTVEALSAGSSIFDIPQVKIAEGNPFFTFVDSVIYKNGSELTAFPPSQTGQFVIPPEIETIGEWAFSGTSLTELVIPGSVRVIGRGAFHSAGIQELVIEEGVEELGDLSFRTCSSLSKVTIPKSVERIGEMAFYNCDCLDSVTISRNCIVDSKSFDVHVEVSYYD